MANKLLQDSNGNASSKRWFGTICLLVAVGLTVADIFGPVIANIELVKTFLWAATVTLVGGTAAEKIEGFKK